LHQDHDAFGTATATWAAPGTTLGNAYTFAGEPFDAQTGTYYLRARHYDPATGRFTQPDPIGFAGGGNLYAYAGNNPATLTDPSGLCPVCWGVLEIGASIYDAFDTGRTLLDPQASTGAKALAVGLFVAGLVGPGEGYNSAREIGGHFLVYRSLSSAGQVQYVGITDDFARRAAEHRAIKGIDVEPIPGLNNLSQRDALAVEQALIESYGLGRNGGTLVYNKNNAIGRRHDKFLPGYVDREIARGREILEMVGYKLPR
jgi:RHS repeat-associated protein